VHGVNRIASESDSLGAERLSWSGWFLSGFCEADGADPFRILNPDQQSLRKGLGVIAR